MTPPRPRCVHLHLIFRLHVVCVALVAAVALPGLAIAQSATDQPAPDQPAPGQPAQNWTVSVDPLTSALGYVHVQVERALGDSFSVYAGPHLRLFNGLLSEPDDDFLGLGAELGVRYFFEGEAPRGWWVLARGVGARVSAEVDGAPLTGFGGYASALGGHTWIVGEHVVLSGGIGVQYIDYTIGDMGSKTLAPALHTAVGVAFLGSAPPQRPIFFERGFAILARAC